jgi:hypothetical protein
MFVALPLVDVLVQHGHLTLIRAHQKPVAISLNPLHEQVRDPHGVEKVPGAMLEGVIDAFDTVAVHGEEGAASELGLGLTAMNRLGKA